MPFADQPQLLLFFLFASVMILSSLGVIFHPNAITAAVLLVLSFFSLAAIYAVMNAVFIATMQLLVYAGAIMVLVVFVLMLLSLREDDTKLFLFEKPIKKLLYLGLVMFLGVLLITAVQDGIPSENSPKIGYTKTRDGRSVDYSFAIHPRWPESKEFEEYKSKGLSIRPPSLVEVSGNTAVVGSAMFLRYLLPFELISILLLAAVLGVVVLRKKEFRKRNGRRKVMSLWISGIPIHYYLILAMIIFTIGVAGVMVRRSAVLIFMSVELILNSVNLVFVTFSKALYQVDGEVVVFFVMAIAAAEAAIGLAIVIAIHRIKKTSYVDEMNLMKW